MPARRMWSRFRTGGRLPGGETRRSICRSLKYRLSNNTGAVNRFFPHLCMHSEKSATSFSLKVLVFQPLAHS
jgi:hypothetical protein